MAQQDIALSLPVGMQSFKDLISNISPKYSICVRGRHAVGKSEGVYQAATVLKSDFYKDQANMEKYSWSYEKGLPVIERRLSQMTEGDIIGLPFMDGEDTFDKEGNRVTYASTQFKPCDWLLEACKRPVLLFLDERNRALDGVKQAVFQLTDSKTFYGYKLHPETRIVIAENIGDEYQVQACDPAEISRCTAVVTLEPSVEDWIDYAKKINCDEATIDFIITNGNRLEHIGTCAPNKKYPDRRAWVKLDEELRRTGLFEDAANPLFRVFAGSFLGVETGNMFFEFCKSRDRQVGAKDILSDWNKAKKRLMKGGSISNELFVECGNKLTTYLEKEKATKNQTVEVAKFLWDCPPEPRMAAYSNLSKNVDNLIAIHPLVQELIVATATAAEIPEMGNLDLHKEPEAPVAEAKVAKRASPRKKA